MNKNMLQIIPAIILISIIIIIGYNTYKDAVKKDINPISIIPINSALILEIKNLNKTTNNLTENNAWKKLLHLNSLSNFNKNLTQIKDLYSNYEDLFSSNKLFISLHKYGSNNNNLLFLGKINKLKFNIENISSVIKNEINESNYDSKKIYNINLQDIIYFFAFHEDIIFFSKSKMIIEDVIKQISNNENLLTQNNFQASYQTVSKASDVNLFLNINSLINTLNVYFKEDFKNTHLSGWIANDVKITNNAFISNGYGSINKKIKNYLDIFNNQITEEINIMNIAPKNTSAIFSIGFDNPKNIYKSKNTLLQKQGKFWSWNKNIKKLQDSTYTNYVDLIKEIEKEAGAFFTYSSKNTNKYTYFKAINSITTSSFIQNLIYNKSNYRGYVINQCKDPNLINNLFGEIFSSTNSYFTVIEDYFIFGPSKLSIQYIIDNYNAKNTLKNSDSFKKFRPYLSSKSNLTLYINPSKAITQFTKNIKVKYRDEFKINTDSISKLTSFSIQASSRNNLLLNNINLFYDEKFKQALKEEWFIQLDSSLIIEPQFVYNHFTKEKMILAQTKKHTLYAINSKGEIIWKKPIGSKILGEINSIDIYKNNKYQCIFNTNEYLYVIDRNGEFVSGFPKKLPYTTKLGHSLFDYNKSKRYRIMIIGEDNHIYNIDHKGKKVKGWKYKKANQKITQSLSHYKVKDKDYILKQTNSSNFQLLAINGSKRVNFNSKNIINFTSEKMVIDKNGNLYTITKENKLWKGFINGSSNEISLPKLDTNSKIIINNLNNESQLIFNNKKTIYVYNHDSFEEIYSVEMEDIIEDIRIVKDLLIVTTVNNKLFVFKNEILLKDFPLRTDGILNISDINNNNKMNIINTENGCLYNYELLN